MLVKGTIDIAVHLTSPITAELSGRTLHAVENDRRRREGLSTNERTINKIAGSRPVITDHPEPAPSRRNRRNAAEQMAEQRQKPRVLMQGDSPEAIKAAVSENQRRYFVRRFGER